MKIQIIDDYFDSSIHKPFFLAVGDAGYNSYLQALKNRTVSYIRISEFCRARDKKPDLDLLREKLETCDVSFSTNNIVVLGLGEYLAMEGDTVAKAFLSELVDYNLGNAQAILLLRGVGSQVKSLVKNDSRLIESGRLEIEDDLRTDIRLRFSDPDLAIYEISGIQDALRHLEDGNHGELNVNTYMTFPNSILPIHVVNNAYEAINKRINISDKVKEPLGTKANWELLLKELRTTEYNIDKVFTKYGFDNIQYADIHDILYENDFKGWLFYISLMIENKINLGIYINYVLNISNGFDDFKVNVRDAIIGISHNDPDFPEYYSERKIILAKYSEPEIAQFVAKNRIDPTESVYKLTDNTKVEKQEVIIWIANHGIPDKLDQIYPDLFAYLQDYKFRTDDERLSARLTSYFTEYKKLKMENSLKSVEGEKFLKEVDELATNRIYNSLPTRDELVRDTYSENTQLFWIDALGVEYLAYIESLAKADGLDISIKIGRAELPTITCINKAFFDNWPEHLRHPKEEELDELKHKEKGGYYYSKDNPYPIHLADELLVIKKAVTDVAITLGQRAYDHVVITSDHGASRLAVLRNKEEKYDTDTRGDHSGRCCKYFKGCDLPFAIKDEQKGYITLADYGRFKGSRKANVEVHGGASLEEVVVPVIVFSLKDTETRFSVVNKDNIKADFKTGIEFDLFVNKKQHEDIFVGYGIKKYKAAKTDDQHYHVKISEITQSGDYPMDIYIGDKLSDHLSLHVKSKSASMNSAFDDLF